MYLLARCNDSSSLYYHKIHIRGVYFNIYQAVINSFLGHVDSPPLGEAHLSIEDLILELTAGIKRAWPLSGQLSAATLSVKYAILQTIGIDN